MTRAEMTHRIGRFYTGQPSWRTRLRSLRRRLGDGSLPLSEEEQLIEARKYILAEERAEGARDEPVRALRIAYPLPPVLLAADGKTSFRYVKALKNASTSILNMLLEITGEAAWRSWDAEAHLIAKSPQPHRIVRKANGRREVISAGKFKLKRRQGELGAVQHTPAVVINEQRQRLHGYMRARPFTREPYADIRFCVVRDPVERFVSGVNQLSIMTFHKRKTLPAVTSATIDKWLENMAGFYAQMTPAWSLAKNYDALSAKKQHLLRQTGFLGCDAGWYTHIFSTRRPQEFHDFLSELAGKRLSVFDANSLASRQGILSAQGMSLERPQLTAAQRRKVEALYAEDYRVFGRWF